jgi:GNAT superfamily N-acetyltransferase
VNPSSAVSVVRCRDAATIERFLSEDYFDYPVCLFSQRLLRAAARWLSESKDVYFMVAEDSTHPAGFVFAHTLGFHLWRRFARQHPWLLPHTLWVLARLRLFRRWSDPQSRFGRAMPRAAPAEVARLGLPRIEEPFRWRVPDSTTGYVDLLFVSPEFRGRDFGPLMLQDLVREMRSGGVLAVQAHIDPANHASARAFLKAGWRVVETSTHDLLATVDCNHARP